jgi:hypothetical protein
VYMGVYGCVWVCARLSETEAEERGVGETKKKIHQKHKIDTYVYEYAS